MRVGRRGVLGILAAALFAAVGFMVAATLHRADALRSEARLHGAIEVILWTGAVGAALAFAWAFRRFRDEVRVEKAKDARREVRQEYLREIRDYELTRSGPGDRWNN